MMNDAALRKIDLNLLLAFSVLMQERNVSRAAERLLLGQPGLSAALKRLREALDDELFVRVGRGLQADAAGPRHCSGDRGCAGQYRAGDPHARRVRPAELRGHLPYRYVRQPRDGVLRAAGSADPTRGAQCQADLGGLAHPSPRPATRRWRVRSERLGAPGAGLLAHPPGAVQPGLDLDLRPPRNSS